MIAEIERIAALIEERKAAFHAENPKCLHEIIPLDLDFLTPEERGEFHRAKLALPSQGQLMREARERLMRRAENRKRNGFLFSIE